MTTIVHSSLTDPQLHEPKGISTASSGEVYVANGSGSGTWSGIATPGLVLIQDIVQSNVGVSGFTNGVSGVDFSAYTTWMIQVYAQPQTGGTYLGMEVGTGAGPVYQTTSYQYGNSTLLPSVGILLDASKSATSIPLSVTDNDGDVTMSAYGVNSGAFVDSTILVNNLASTVIQYFRYHSAWNSATQGLCSLTGAGSWFGGSLALTGIRFLFNTGNIAAIRTKLYAVVD